MLTRPKIELCRRNILDFTQVVFQGFEATDFHRKYYTLLNKFAHGEIRKLIVSMPPQHGKSAGSSRILPAYILGNYRDKKVVIASYAGTFAQGFNRDVQRLIDHPAYRVIFPLTKLYAGQTGAMGSYVRNTTEFEIVDAKGSLKVVGRGGQLTGSTVDVMIMDDLYKDFAEGNSPVIREAAWDWYVNVVKTRLHNDSQELIVFTRWHEDDIIGRMESVEKVVEIHSMDDLVGLDARTWVKINFPALQDREPTDLDPRGEGEPLWPTRQSKEFMLEKQNLNPVQFSCLYQGDPAIREGYLYGEFKTWDSLPDVLSSESNYTDTADMGSDFLCSICYSTSPDGMVYVTDVIYTQEPMEKTEEMVPAMLMKNGTKTAYIESNNGGRSFARVVQQKSPQVAVTWFYQGANKESRILTNAALVTKNILFPPDWARRWPDFHNHLRLYKRVFAANKYHDAPDCLTGIVEKEIARPRQRGVRRLN